MTRLQCCIPFCARTTANKAGWSEWICQQHWSAVPREKRRIYTRAKRKGWGPAAARIWRRMKAIATEKAGGLA